ncbi:MAG TPA: hypothetical protein P5517_00600 [Candidatus Saccharicenans sp.]|nr:hypothetical protein [Candidatus Saccharicenans sp.]HRT24921.1 hypothetical protein [Candidatus Saccharicenans sp.]HRV05374.1 hypothetical protein [Candidatus Saccharicenans sp.]
MELEGLAGGAKVVQAVAPVVLHPAALHAVNNQALPFFCLSNSPRAPGKNQALSDECPLEERKSRLDCPLPAGKKDPIEKDQL